MMDKRLSCGAFLLLGTALYLMALLPCRAGTTLTFNPLNKYKIVCLQYGKGGIGLGAEQKRQTPLYYVTMSEDDADMFWFIDEVTPGLFTLKNASSGEYIYYDGVYSGSTQRYVSLSQELKGDSSLWKITKTNNGAYQIASALDVYANMFNVRSSYVVGTFPEQSTSNSLFTFCNEDGSEYVPVERSDESYGTTFGGMYWERTGLEMPVALTTDRENPILYSIKNVRSNKYVTVGTDNFLTQTDETTERFFFVETADGVSIYTKDGTWVSGFIGGTGSKNVQVKDGTDVDAGKNVWNFEFSDQTGYSGYGIYVVKCPDNGEDNNYIWTKQNYWNDLGQSDICYFSLDNGSTFVFYSSDERHRLYLAQNGINVPQTGSAGSTADVLNALDSLVIGHKTVVFDKKYNNFMLPVAETFEGDGSFVAEVCYKPRMGEDFELRIDGETVTNGEKHTFGNIEGGEAHAMTVWKNGKKIGAANLLFTFMPIVELNGDYFSSGYHAGTIRVNDPSTNAVTDSLYHANIRYRGATAMSKQKKAYAIKLTDADGNSIDRQLLGLRNDNNWILDAMAIDAGRMRNRVATDLWNDFSTPPYQKTYEKKAINGTRGKFVEVLLNGYYAGIYCMTEKLDRKQLKLKKYVEGNGVADTVRGTLYKSSDWGYEVFMGHENDTRVYPMTAPQSYSNNSGTWCGWENKYPDLDDGEPIDWGPLYKAVNLVASGSKTTFAARVSLYFDLPVFLDYYLFIELILATDNHGKNMYLYNYDKTRFNKMGAAPWDLDGVFGRRWDGSTNLTSNAKRDFVSFLWSYEHGEYTLFKRLAENNVTNWNQKLAARYAELRPTYFSHASLLNRFKKYRELFRASGADQREIKRWQGSDGITMDFDQEITYLDDWIKTRLATLDAQYNYTVPDGIYEVRAPYIGVSGAVGKIYVHTTSPKVAVKVYNLMGQLQRNMTVDEGVTCIDNLAPGIYLVNDKKVVVR